MKNAPEWEQPRFQDRDQKKAKIDELVALLDEYPHQKECDLPREHLQNAAAYLLGAMLPEYEMNLELARDSLGALSDHRFRTKLHDAINSLLGK